MFKEFMNDNEIETQDKSLLHIILSWLNKNKKYYSTEILLVEQNSVLTLHTRDKKELIIVISGNGGFTINGKGTIIKFGDLLYTPSNSVRTLANVEEEPLCIVSIQFTMDE
ncbi:MAG: cupin domain-containing protein [Pseudomonadota bacterium]